MSCCDHVEPCHVGECDGFNEVVALLPTGKIWDVDRGGVYAQYIKALGHIKTELNQIICQEYNEMTPCESERLFGYWADFYKLPPCVEQTKEKLCEWIALLYGGCPIGSQGFLRQAIEFVMGDEVEVSFNIPEPSDLWKADSICADDNAIVIHAPAELYHYYEMKNDSPNDSQDGIDSCRRYFIPDIECLRPCVFPMGLGVGYKTIEEGKHDINNAINAELSARPTTYIYCNEC